MFRTKSEVDQHVIPSLQKIKSARERNLRALHAAQLYYKVQDFNSARKYVLMYLSEKEDSASAHKLLGDALEGLGQKSKAIASYKRSLELQSNQPPLLLKICELLCDKEVGFDVAMAKYCLDRAAPVFPHAPAVFTLREKLLTADSSVTPEDMEKLILSELKARPADVNVRIKLLKSHLDLKKVELAYNHVLDVESKQLHPDSLAWYQCSTQIFKAYHGNFPKKCDWEFFIAWMSALDRLCFLSLDETKNESCDVVVVTEAIYTLDQTIYLSTKNVVKAPELYMEFIRHVTGQLAFHLAVLLMKRAKKESSLWKETKKMVGPLLLFAACDPADADSNWCLSIKDSHRKLLNIWAHQGRCRYAQSGHLLNSLAKESQSVKMFIDKVNHFCVTDWRKRVFEKTFLSIDEVSAASSYFVTSSNYAPVPQKFVVSSPSAHVHSFEIIHHGSLHHLVWLGLQSLEEPRSVRSCKLTSTIHTTMFKNMLFSVTNLSNTGVETLNQLDVDAFLCATIFCTGAVIEDQQMNGFNSPDKPALLPADITYTLCTTEQANWWASACSIPKGGGRGLGNNIKMSDIRHVLQRGIEVVRGDGLPLPLMVCLARNFGQRAADADSAEEIEGCEHRSVDLWRIAIPTLERLSNNQNTNTFASKSSLFEYAITDLLPNEVTALLEEGRLYVANHYMKKEDYEKALDIFKQIRSAQANFNQAIIYLKLAEEEVCGFRGEEITSTLRCKQAALVTKARNALHVARDMIKGDHGHPLHHKIKTKLIEVEDLFSRIERERAHGDGVDGGVSDDSMSLLSSDNSVEKLASLLTNPKQSMNPNAYSTPRRNLENKFKQKGNVSEIANELASLQQSSNQLKLQQILEHSKLVLDRMDSIIFEQRSQRSMIEDLTAKFNSMETEVKSVLAEIKKEVKRPDLYNMLDDEDYNPDEILQTYSQNQMPVSQPNLQRQPVPTQRVPQIPQVPETQLGGVGPSYFSPRVDQMYQNSMNFFNPHATLPFVDGHSVPEYLRTLHHSKFPLQVTSMPATMSGHLNLSQVPPFQAGVVPQIPPGTVPALGPSMVPVSGAVPPMVPGPIPQLGVHGFPQKFSGTPDYRGPTNVVITASDALPTGTPPALPILSVTVPPEHRLGDSSAAHQFQISLPNAQNVQNKPQFTSSQPQETVESDDNSSSSANQSQSSEEGGFAAAPLTSLVSQKPTPNNSSGSGILGSATTTPKDKSSILAPSRLFAPSPSTPTSTFGTPQAGNTTFGSPNLFAKSPLFGGTPQSVNVAKPSSESPKAESKPTQATTEAPKQVFGGFTFSTTPKFSATPEAKPEPKTVTETKKTDSPFANFSFSKPGETKGLGFFGGGDASKASGTKPTESTKAPSGEQKITFGSGANFLDFGSLASSSPNQNSLLSKLLSDKKPASTPNVFATAGAPVFGQAPKTASSPQVDKSQDGDDFEPTVDFAPVVPLPELVDVKSGEENDDVLFSERAKLYRYDKNIKEWRDRGVGEMKILKNKDTGAVRLLMRREQVYKVCCNHRITKDLELTKSKMNENAYCWAAKDFSDDTNGTLQQFTIRFKTEVQGLNFQEKFKQAQAEHVAKSPGKSEVKPANEGKGSDKPPLSSLVTKAAGSWDCDSCCVNNTATATACIACSTPKPGCEPPKKADKPKPTFTFGMPAVSSAPPVTNPSSANTVAEKAQKAPASGGFTFGSSTANSTKPEPAKFSFGAPKTEPSKPLFGVSTGNTQQDGKPPLSAVFSHAEGSWECKDCYSRNEGNVSQCAACQSGRPGVTVVSVGNASGATSQPFSFGNLSSSLSFQPTNITKDVTITPVSVQKDPSPTGFTFGSGSTTTGAAKPFSFGGTDTFGKKTFQFLMPAIDQQSSPSKNNDTASDAEVSDREDLDDSIHFQPAIPLPELVAVKTGEEDEIVLYSHRAKVYRYDKAAKEWKERGTGDIKILQHSTTGKKRLLMRREPIMKLCLNHYLNDDIVMNEKDDKSFMWYATDFSLDDKAQEQFAVRFKTSEIAKGFYEAVEQAKKKTLAVPPTSNSADADDDVVFVKTVTVSDELVKKARSLQLPDNFYSYLDKRPCRGCCGCEGPSDDESESNSSGTTVVSTPDKPSFQAPVSIFGGKGLATPAGTKADVSIFGTPRAQPTELFGSPKVADTTVFGTPQASIFGGQKPEGKDNLSLNQPIFGGGSNSSFSFSTGATFSFGQATPATPQEKPSQQSSSQPFFSKDSSFLAADKSNSSSIFGNVNSTNTSSTTQSSIFSTGGPSFGSLAASSPAFPSKDVPTFGALANTSPAAPSFLTTKSNNFKWEGAGSSLFSHLAAPSTAAKAQDGGEAGDDDPEKEVAVHFEPIVPLPDKIELSTGEEDEEVLFEQRAKLYRYSTDTKEWKERGIGVMKILKHKTNNLYRFLMRREQVHKIVCNMRITPDLTILPNSKSENSVSWTFPNLAQEYTEPQVETLALKLKNKDLLDKFLAVANDAIAALKKSS